MPLINRVISFRLNKQVLFASFGFCGALFLIALNVLPVSYETIDDFFMNSIASGYFGGTPDEHLIYTNFIIGLVLKSLFTFWSSFNWYAAYLVFALFLSFYTLSYLFFKRLNFITASIILLYFFLVYYVKFIQQLQFTTASGSLAIAGVLLLLDQLFSAEFKLNKKMVLPIGLIVLSGMMRFPSASLVLILLAPLFLILPFNLKTNIKSALVFISVFIGITLVQFADTQYYASNADWKTFNEHLRESNPYNDNKAYYSTYYSSPDKPYLKNGWSQNDLVLFTAYFRDFDPVYNSKAYANIKETVDAAPYSWKEFKNDLLYKFRSIHLYLLLFFTFLLLPFNRLIKPILLIASVVFIVWYVNTAFQMKDRVLYLIHFGFSLSLIISLLGIYERSEYFGFREKLRGFSIPVLLSLLAILAINSSINSYKKQVEETSFARNLVNQKFDFADKSKFLVFWGASINYESLNPFKNSFNYESTPKVYSISTFAKIPLYQKQFNTVGANSFIDLIPMNQVEILGPIDKDSTSNPNRLIQFYKEHLGIELKLDYYVKSDSMKFQKYSFTPKDI